MQEINEIVLERLEKLNWSQNELARKTGYSKSYISELLLKKKRWNEDIMKKVFNVLDIEINYIINLRN